MAEEGAFSHLQVPLPVVVSDKFTSAKNNESLVLSETTAAELTIRGGIALQLRYCPSLAKKPSDKKTESKRKSSQQKFDPFDKPSAELLVASIPASATTHNLVLNKFPVIANHSIIATVEDKPQTDLLEESDLGVTYEAITNWQRAASGRSLYAFFNSGEHSGASQVHRHLQLLPVEDMRSKDPNSAWLPLCDSMTEPYPSYEKLQLLHNPSLPFVHFALPLDTHSTPRIIWEKYMVLLKSAYAFITKTRVPQSPSDLHNVEPTVAGTRTTKFSYNLGMTSKSMAIMPRRSETATIRALPNEEGSVNINGTILAGTLMVKSESEWNILRAEPHELETLLQQVGYTWNSLPEPKSRV